MCEKNTNQQTIRNIDNNNNATTTNINTDKFQQIINLAFATAFLCERQNLKEVIRKVISQV